MKAIILKCAPHSQFHFGQVAVDADTSLNDTSDFIHSDTLFSAIINLAAKAFPYDLDKILSLLGYGVEEPTLRLSSGFYCLEHQGQYLYFLPKPLNSQLTIEKEHKQLKKIQFISKAVWEQKLTPDDWLKEQRSKIIQKTFVVTQQEYSDFKLTAESRIFGKEALPKVAIHKDTKANSFYYQTNIQIGSLKETGIHFYFLIDGWEKLTETDKSIMDIILKMLPSEGIGGERTTGCGIFKGMAQKDFNLATNTPKQFVTLSLTNPNTKEEFALFNQYDIIKRGGRRLGVADENSVARYLKRINMITEGSVVAKAIRGRIQDISPEELTTDDKTYLRNGIGFSLPY
jgi:CRISPR-associated protein Csm4